MIPFRDNIPTRHYPLVTVSIILLNVAAFIYELSLPAVILNDFLLTFGLVPSRLQLVAQNPVPPVIAAMAGTFVTSTLLHGGVLHLLGNMLYLWVFGDNVEDRMGSLRFLIFYILCGMVSGATHVVFNLDSNIPTIGASGAVAGVLGAYLVSYPFARVSTLIPLFLIWPVVELPALLVLGAWFLVQIMNGTAALTDAAAMMGGVAWWAHIGGFLCGVALLYPFARQPVRRYSW